MCQALRTIWRIEVGDGSFFFSFFALFHLNVTFFRQEFPFKTSHEAVALNLGVGGTSEMVQGIKHIFLPH